MSATLNVYVCPTGFLLCFMWLQLCRALPSITAQTLVEFESDTTDITRRERLRMHHNRQAGQLPGDNSGKPRQSPTRWLHALLAQAASLLYSA